MKTKDGYELVIGMWVYDACGVYEIKGIHEDCTGYTLYEVNEIGFDDDDLGGYTVIDRFTRTEHDMSKCYYV